MQTFEVQRGAILSLGFVIGRILARNKREQCVSPSLEKMDTGNDLDQALMKIITEAVKQIGLLSKMLISIILCGMFMN